MSTSADVVTEYWQDKARGLLLGCLCGDGLANRLAGDPAPDTSGNGGRSSLHYTLTGALALAEADFIGTHGPLHESDQESLAIALGHTWWRNRHRSHRGRAAGVLQAVLEGTSWREARSVGDQPGIDDTPAAVAGVAALSAIGERTSAALKSAAAGAAVLHPNPLARETARCHVSAVALALRSTPGRDLPMAQFLPRVTEVCGPRLRARLSMVRQLHQDARPSDVASSFGTSGCAVDSVPSALAAFLRHPDDPRQALDFACRIGSQSTGVAAMTGALIGARHGACGLPVDWVDAVEHSEKIKRIADDNVRRYRSEVAK